VTALSDCTVKRPLFSFTSMLSFAAGGTLSGTTVNAAFAPGQRTSDYGVWSREPGAHRYSAVSRALIAFSTPASAGPPPQPGVQAGSQIIRQEITQTDDDHFSSDAVTIFYDTAGQKYREMCASATAVRLQ
jgi:hypothetical protein